MICPGRGKIYLICYVILCFTHFLLISWPGFSQYFHVVKSHFQVNLLSTTCSTTGGFTNEPLVEHPNFRVFHAKISKLLMSFCDRDQWYMHAILFLNWGNKHPCRVITKREKKQPFDSQWSTVNG